MVHPHRFPATSSSLIIRFGFWIFFCIGSTMSISIKITTSETTEPNIQHKSMDFGQVEVENKLVQEATMAFKIVNASVTADEDILLLRKKPSPSSSIIPPQPIPPNGVQISLPTKPIIQHVPSAPMIITKPTKPNINFVKPTGVEVDFVKPPPQIIQKPSKPDITIVTAQKPTLTLPSLPDITIVKPPKPGKPGIGGLGGSDLPGATKPPIATQSPIINKIIGLMIKMKNKLHAVTGINIQYDKPQEPIIMPIFDTFNKMSGALSKYYNKMEDFFELLIMDTPFRSMRLDDNDDENQLIGANLNSKDKSSKIFNDIFIDQKKKD